MSRWNPGIPEEFREEDKLTQAELMQMAIAEVKKELKENGSQLIGVNPDVRAIPNIIARKNGRDMFITVKAGVVPVVPRPIPNIARGMLIHAEKHGADCYFAGVAFGSADDERFKAGLLLRDDDYLCSYDGMKKIMFD